MKLFMKSSIYYITEVSKKFVEMLAMVSGLIRYKRTNPLNLREHVTKANVHIDL